MLDINTLPKVSVGFGAPTAATSGTYYRDSAINVMWDKINGEWVARKTVPMYGSLFNDTVK